MKLRNKIIIGALGISLFSGTAGVYAGTAIEMYKTARGNIATVEPENVHKNRIGITINGKEIKQDTWYADGVTYAPIREVANMLGASVEYNSATQSADIITEPELLNLLGLELQRTYYGVIKASSWARDSNFEFRITRFNPSTNEFDGTIAIDSNKYTVAGTISATKIVFKDSSSRKYELNYNGPEDKFVGKWSSSNWYVWFSLD